MARNRIKGITVEIGGDTTKLDKALAGTNKQLSATQQSLKDVERLLKLDPGNTELLAQKQKLLAQAASGTADKLKTLREAAQSADEALQRGRDYQAKYEPLKAQLDSVAASMQGLEANEASMQAKLESGEISTEQYDAFKKKLEDTRKAHQALQQAVKDLDKEFAGARLDQSQYDALQRELAESEREAKDAEKAFKDCSSGLDELGRKAGTVSDKAGKVAEAFAPVTATVGALAGAALATVPATEELRGDLSMLENNARQAGVGMDAVQQAFLDFNAVSGETDSSIEAISNLLQAGFTESNLQQAVEGLANAAITFPDTLKIESLADSLQETLATGEATGQFGELLDRLGIGAENFSAGLAMCTTEAQKQDYALNALVGGPLKGAYEGWAESNQELMENRQSSMELQKAMADLAELLVPIITQLTDFATEFLEWFTSLDDGSRNAIVAVGLLIAAIGPMAGAVKAVTDVLPFLLDLFSGIGVKGLIAAVAVGLFVGLAAKVADLWDDMTGVEKVISVIGLLTAVVFGAALAFGALQSALSMGIAGAAIAAGILAVVAAISSATQRANEATQNLNRSMSSAGGSIPGFATGGVVPPNNPFLAVLGDNRQEPEVVAPYSTIKQAAGEALAERGNSGGTGRGDVYLDGTKVGRVLYSCIEGERTRLGVKLTGGRR
ncbi:hypothetical protein WMO64_16625 [Pseudoflavonifractor sp. CLA-AP-H29]|uniref:Phage tail tape measure protein n=1 Tax=Pseudoflavonifractor intestinihominis TaxID=3133171 RepID=A0ABV1EGG0_9FIRM